MFPLFNILLAPLVPALWLYTLHRRFIQKKTSESFRAQWGHISPEMRKFGARTEPKIWLHAVSVGETMAAKPIARALKTEIPGVRIALSATTDTGHEIAKSLLGSGDVDCVFYFPLDLAPIQNRVLDALSPNAIGFIETELWPNLLHLARKRGIETFLLNGRVSDNLLKTAPRLGPIWKWMSGNVSGFLMRGEDDAARLVSLGVAPQKITVTGDVKLEAPPVASETLRAKWRDELGLSEEEKVLICGSTHAGEEEIFLEIARQKPEWKIAFAPRHPNRFDEVAGLIEKAGMEVVRRSSHKKWKGSAVFLLDSIGELGDFYALGDAAFVGGSLVQRGGHNLLEPILRGVPVCFGWSVANFGAQSELIQKNRLGRMISDPRVREEIILDWLDTLSFDREKFALQVETALAPNRGAAAAMARLMGEKITTESRRHREIE